MKQNLNRWLIAIPLSLGLLAQSPITENSTAGLWDDSNKAALLRGEILLHGKIIFKIERLGNLALIRLPKKPKPIEAGLWSFEVSNRGQNFYASWDNKKQAWKFNLHNKGNYVIYASRRKNNIEKISHSWFNFNY